MEKEKRLVFKNLYEPKEEFEAYRDLSPDDLEFADEEDLSVGEKLNEIRKDVKFKNAIKYELYDQNNLK